VLEAVCRWIEQALEPRCCWPGPLTAATWQPGSAANARTSSEGCCGCAPGVRAGPAERDLPTGDRPAAAAGWLSGAPAGLRSHLDRALGQRTPGVVAALSAGGPGDEHYQDALTGGPGMP